MSSPRSTAFKCSSSLEIPGCGKTRGKPAYSTTHMIAEKLLSAKENEREGSNNQEQGDDLLFQMDEALPSTLQSSVIATKNLQEVLPASVALDLPLEDEVDSIPEDDFSERKKREQQEKIEQLIKSMTPIDLAVGAPSVVTREKYQVWLRFSDGGSPLSKSEPIKTTGFVFSAVGSKKQ